MGEQICGIVFGSGAVNIVRIIFVFAFLAIVRTIRRGEQCGEQIAALHRSGC